MWGQKQESEDAVDGSIGRRRGRDPAEFPADDRSHREAPLGDRPGSRAMRDLTQVSEHWAHGLQDRARDMAKELRSQGERAVGTVSQQVEHNPLTSLAVAFAVGFLCATLIRR